jgi:hypothetical protein
VWGCTVGVERNQHIAEWPDFNVFLQDELLVENFDCETPEILLVGKQSTNLDKYNDFKEMSITNLLINSCIGFAFAFFSMAHTPILIQKELKTYRRGETMDRDPYLTFFMFDCFPAAEPCRCN